jgi:predicted transglutaminase-like cysteine proteinase
VPALALPLPQYLRLHAPPKRPGLRVVGTAVALAAALGLVVAGTVSVYSQATQIRLEEKVLASAEAKYGAAARKRLEDWQKLLDGERARTESQKLTLVNDFFNQITWVSDPDHWKKADYWATPTEMLATNGGDCEDFAIAKYFTLVALGVPDEKLKITYVKTRDPNPINQSHMVLAYYSTPTGQPLILDNLIPQIKSGAQRPDLTPVYSFNGSGLWLAKEKGAGKQVEGGSSNIAFWRDLTSRMGKEFN